MTADQFTQAFSAGYWYVVHLLESRGARLDLAEEIAQDAWARAWFKRDQFVGSGAFRNWVIVIATNLYRRSFALARRESPLLNFENLLGYREPFERRIEAAQVLAKCSKRDAKILRQRYIEDSLPIPLTGYMRLHLFRAQRSARESLRS